MPPSHETAKPTPPTPPPLRTHFTTPKKGAPNRPPGPHLTPPEILFDRRREGVPEISFLVPVYNERAFIEKTLARVRELPLATEVIVVDDGSTDGTRDILRHTRGEGMLLLFHPSNQGKGGAIRTALVHARGTYTVIQDADLEYDPLDCLDLLGRAREEKRVAVFGSRFLSKNPCLYRRFSWGNKVLTGWINILCGTSYTDTYTCYKLLTTPLFRSLDLQSTGFEMEAEISVKLACRGIAVAECPIHYTPRKIEEGKKIGWKDAWRGAVKTLYWRWSERRSLYPLPKKIDQTLPPPAPPLV